jgi:hypothetical protein
LNEALRLAAVAFGSKYSPTTQTVSVDEGNALPEPKRRALKA